MLWHCLSIDRQCYSTIAVARQLDACPGQLYALPTLTRGIICYECAMSAAAMAVVKQLMFTELMCSYWMRSGGAFELVSVPTMMPSW